MNNNQQLLLLTQTAVSLFCFISILVYPAMSAPEPSDTTPTKATTLATDWRLTVRTDRPRYAVGEDVTLTIILTNTSRSSQTIFRGELLYDYRVSIYHGRALLPLANAAVRSAIDGGAKSVSLEAGKGLKRSAVLRDILEAGGQLPPGDYRVEIRRDFRDRFNRPGTKPTMGKDLLEATTQFTVSKQ
jgi:hypothetical protein